MRLRLPKFGKQTERPKSNSKPKGTSSGKKRAAAAGLGLGSLLGRGSGSVSGKNRTGAFSGPSLSGSRRNSGKANYGPLPSFSVPTKTAKKYSNPTLSNISEQLTNIISGVSVIENVLRDQLKLQKFEYKENARIQREINAESVDKLNSFSTSGGMGILGGLGLGALFAGLKDIDLGFNEKEGSSWWQNLLPLAGLPLLFGGGDKTKAPVVKPDAKKPVVKSTGKTGVVRDYSFVKASEALDANGKLKKGYEPVQMKDGSVRYRRAAPSPSLLSKAKGWFGKAKDGVKSVAKTAVTKSGGLLKAAKTIGLRAMLPLTVAAIAWDSWSQIRDLPSDMDPQSKKREVTRIVAKLVKDVGIGWAGFALGALAGSVVPGFGTLAGALAGAGGAIAANAVLGDSTDELVDKLVNKIFPVKKEAVTSRPVSPEPVKDTSSPQVAKKESVTKKREVIKDVIYKAASKAGVDPSALFTIAKKETPSIDFNSNTSEKIFDLTMDQWSHIKSRYGSSITELNAGVNDIRANAIAAAILAKESRDFLMKNGIAENEDTLFPAYLLGESGLTKMLSSDSGTLAKDIAPGAANKRPELFHDNSAVPISISTFMDRSFDVDLSQNQQLRNQSSPPSVYQDVAQPIQDSGGSNPTPASDTGITPSSPPSNSPPAPSPSPTSSATPTPAPTATPIETPPDAMPIPNIDVGNMAEDIKTTSMEIEKEESQITANIIKPKQTQATNTILPSTNAGYTGTGNVPDPTFGLGSLGKELFYSSSVL